MAKLPVPGDIYQHWKGKNYQVILITKDEKTCEQRIIYCPVGQDNAWSREYKEWNDIVDVIEGESVPRFKFIRNVHVNSPETYSEKEVEELLHTQRGNCFVAVNAISKEASSAAITAPEPAGGDWKK